MYVYLQYVNGLICFDESRKSQTLMLFSGHLKQSVQNEMKQLPTFVTCELVMSDAPRFSQVTHRYLQKARGFNLFYTYF